MWKKILPFVQSYKVTPPLHHPKNNFMSKWHLIQPLQREIYKKPNAYFLDSCPEQKSLVTYHTLRSLYVCVWLVNTWNSTAPTGSPTICMWSLADICEQWERNLSLGSADVRGAGTRFEPLRTSAWEVTKVVTKPEFFVAKEKILVALATVLVAISSPVCHNQKWAVIKMWGTGISPGYFHRKRVEK